MKLSSITIHGMHNVKSKTYNLQNTNYFYGPNGAGKSTVLQAIQLAILGYIPGTDKNKTAIFTHSNGNFMAVTAIFDTGEQITRSWEKTSKDITASVNITPVGFNIQSVIADIELPIFDFSSFIGLTANKLKDWFINFLPENNTGIDIMDKLNPALVTNSYDDTDLTDAVTDIISGDGSWLDKVRKLNDWCKSEMSLNKAELTRIQLTIQSLVFYDDCDMTVSADTIKEDIRQTDLQRENIAGKRKALASTVNVYNQMQELCNKYHGLNNDDYLSYLISKEAEYSASIIVYNNRIDEIKLELLALDGESKSAKAIMEQGGVCPYTEAKCESIQGLMMNLASEQEQRIKRIAELTDEMTSLSNQVHMVNHMFDQVHNEKIALSGAKSQYAMLEKMYNPSIMGDYDSFDSAAKGMEKEYADLSFKISLLQDQLVHIEANTKYNSLVDTLTMDKFKLEQRIAVLKSWEKQTGVNGMQTEIMVAPFTAFSVKMSEYLTGFFGTKTEAMFVIGEKANSFNFGLIRDANYINFDLLSSGEKCLYTLALMICIIENSESPIKMILADDILDHLDSDRINACFSTLYSSNVQCVLAGVKECQHPDSAKFIINVR